jgi:hypothetical protein
MKRKLLGTGILLLVLLLVMVSCASTAPAEETPAAPPPPVETPTTETPVTQAPASVSQDLIDGLSAAKALAEKNRALSVELEGPKYFSSEWNDVDARYSDANASSLANDASAYQTAINTYNELAVNFENIAANALREKVLEQRTAALDAGIMSISDERFLVAEDCAVTAAAAWEIRDTEVAFQNGRTALSLYGALSAGAEAYKLRMEMEYWIDQAIKTEAYNASLGITYGNYSDLQTKLDSADETAFLAISQYDAGDTNALASAEKALSGYKGIMAEAWTRAATITAGAADKSRTSAMNAKAPVATKPEYDRANGFYTQGQSLRGVNDNQKAAASYYQSIPLFRDAAELAVYKRQQAEAAIAEAERKIAESEQTAGDAEAILEGGVQ